MLGLEKLLSDCLDECVVSVPEVGVEALQSGPREAVFMRRMVNQLRRRMGDFEFREFAEAEWLRANQNHPAIDPRFARAYGDEFGDWEGNDALSTHG